MNKLRPDITTLKLAIKAKGVNFVRNQILLGIKKATNTKVLKLRKENIMPTIELATDGQINDQEFMTFLNDHLDIQKKEVEIMVKEVINSPVEPLKANHIGRNEPCPCGSGKKYKKCCGI